MKKFILFFSLLALLLSGCSSEPNFENEKAAVVEIKNGSAISEFKDCSKLVKKMLTTSPAYLQKIKGLYNEVVDKGGISFGVGFMGSPYHEFDGAAKQSETYDFNIHETYNRKRVLVGQYTFDPIKKQLYELDSKTDSLIAIPFNKSYLPKFDSLFLELEVPEKNQEEEKKESQSKSSRNIYKNGIPTAKYDSLYPPNSVLESPNTKDNKENLNKVRPRRVKKKQ